MLSEWFDAGVEKGATHMIVVCDTFSFEDFPVYVMPEEDVHTRKSEYDDTNMHRITGVYSMSVDKDYQLDMKSPPRGAVEQPSESLENIREQPTAVIVKGRRSNGTAPASSLSHVERFLADGLGFDPKKHTPALTMLSQALLESLKIDWDQVKDDADQLASALVEQLGSPRLGRIFEASLVDPARAVELIEDGLRTAYGSKKEASGTD